MPVLRHLVGLLGEVLLLEFSYPLPRLYDVAKLLVEAFASLRIVPAKLPQLVLGVPDRVIVLFDGDVVMDANAPEYVDAHLDLALAATVIPTLVGFGNFLDVTARAPAGAASGHRVFACLRHDGGGTFETVESTLTVRAVSSPPTENGWRVSDFADEVLFR